MTVRGVTWMKNASRTLGVRQDEAAAGAVDVAAIL
jgi:hypothetical protein